MERLLYEFLDQSRRKRYKKHTIYDYQKTLGEFFSFVRDTYPDIQEITEITRGIILDYEKYLLTLENFTGKVLSRGRRKRYLINLKTFFKYLDREEKIYKNPTLTIALPRERITVIKDILSIEEMDKLLKSCKGSSLKEIRDRAILELLYSSGVRADELCNIEINDIDLKENLLFVRKGKLGNERIIPFGDTANYWITRYIKNAQPLINEKGLNLLFVSMRGRKLQPQDLLRMIKYWAGIAGIEKNITTHTFRHSCAAHMLKGHADIRYVQKQLGHRRISTTEKYLRVEITDLKEVHERCHPREREDW